MQHVRRLRSTLRTEQKIEAERLYVNGWPKEWTLKELAHRFNVTEEMMRNLSMRLSWCEKRKRRWEELYEEYERQKKSGFEGLTKEQKEIIKIRGENAYNTAQHAYVLKSMLNDWLKEHQYKKLDNSLNPKRAEIRDISEAVKINKEIFETIYLTLGPPIEKEDVENKIIWAVPLDDMLEKMDYDELIKHKDLINNILKENYEK